MLRSHFGEHRAEVRRERQVALLVELFARQPGPAAVHPMSLHFTADHEHGAGVSVVGPAIAVLAGHPPELRHRENHHIAHPVTEVGDQRCNRRREIAQAIGQLSRCTALVHVRVPPAHVGEGDLQPQVALDRCDLPQALREWRARVSCPMLRFIALRIRERSMRTASNVSLPVPWMRSGEPVR